MIISNLSLFYPNTVYKSKQNSGRISISFENKISIEGNLKVPMLMEYMRGGYRYIDSYNNSYTYDITESGELVDKFGTGITVNKPEKTNYFTV